METARRRWGWTAVVLALALAASACATGTRGTESMLTQAGFRQVPADTPKKLAHLQTLPERRIVIRTHQGKKYYVYADPDVCKCLYMGNSDQYQRYQQVVQAQSQLYSGGVEEAREWETENAGLQ